jgi:hypothetical protein
LGGTGTTEEKDQGPGIGGARARGWMRGNMTSDGTRQNPDIRSNMSQYDLNGDGKLNESELAAFRAAMASDPQFIKRFDANGDGVLSDEEKAAMLKDRNNTEGMGGPREPGL